MLGVNMYLTIKETAKYLELSTSDIMRLIHEKQIKWIEIDGETLLNTQQFEFFLEQRKKAIATYQEFLDTPIPEDIDIKDED